MLKIEARYLKNQLASLPDLAWPMLNIGCSTQQFSEKSQPHVGDLSNSLASAGHQVINVDIKEDVHVDLVADFTTPIGLDLLRQVNAVSLISSNLIEHIPIPPEEAILLLSNLVKPGGYLILSGPKVFGYHPDPIDNGFRPNADAVSQLIPSEFQILHSIDIQCEYLWHYYSEFGSNKVGFIKSLFNVKQPKLLISRWLTSCRRASVYIVVAEKVLPVAHSNQEIPR
jgi:hypothetical protein